MKLLDEVGWMLVMGNGGGDGTTDGVTLGSEGVTVDESGCIDGLSDGIAVGVAVVGAKPVGFKHNPEC